MPQEVIQWEKLTPEERNMLIHTRVMGNISSMSCPGTIINTGGTNSYYPDLYIWKCDTCGNEYLSHRDNFPLHPRLPHSQYFAEKPEIPRYSQSMDDAWLVLRNIAARCNPSQLLDSVYWAFCDNLLRDELESSYTEIYPAHLMIAYAAKWTPEIICVAALRAFGCHFVEDEQS